MSTFPCHFCPRTFATEKGYKNHFRAYHKGLTPRNDQSSNANIDFAIENITAVAIEERHNSDAAGLDMDVESSSCSSFNKSFEMSDVILASFQRTNTNKEPLVNQDDDDVDSDAGEIDINDEEFIMKMNTEKNERNEIIINDIRLDCSVELMEILNKANTPLYLYKEITNWATNCNLKNEQFFHEKQYSRNTVLKKLEHKFNLQNYHPKTLKVTCPSGISVNIVVHDFETALFSLLSDKDLMDPTNILLNEKEPWVVEEKHEGYADVNSGSLWKKGWENYDPEKKKYCAL